MENVHQARPHNRRSCPLRSEANDRMRAVRRDEHLDRCRSGAARSTNDAGEPATPTAVQSVRRPRCLLHWVSCAQAPENARPPAQLPSLLRVRQDRWRLPRLVRASVYVSLAGWKCPERRARPRHRGALSGLVVHLKLEVCVAGDGRGSGRVTQRSFGRSAV